MFTGPNRKKWPYVLSIVINAIIDKDNVLTIEG